MGAINTEIDADINKYLAENVVDEIVEDIEGKYQGKRYIPLDALSNKNINYCLYCALQHYSERNINETDRYIYRKKINNTELAKELSMSRTTLIKKTKALIDNELIRDVILDNRDEVYYLPCKSNKYLLLDLTDNSMRDLINSNNPNAMKVYLYLKARSDMFKLQNKKNCNMEVEQCFLCKEIGLSQNSRNLLPDYLKLLKDLGLVEYKIVKSENKVIRDIAKIKYIYTVLK